MDFANISNIKLPTSTAALLVVNNMNQSRVGVNTIFSIQFQFRYFQFQFQFHYSQ